MYKLSFGMIDNVQGLPIILWRRKKHLYPKAKPRVVTAFKWVGTQEMADFPQGHNPSFTSFRFGQFIQFIHHYP